MTHKENILAIVAGATDQQRLVIVHRSLDPRDALRVGPVRLYRDAEVEDARCEDSSPAISRPFCEQIQAIRDRPIVLRQESFSPAVGWFTQSEMELTLDQWHTMRSTFVPGRVQGSAHDGPFPSRRNARSLRERVTAARPRTISLDGEVIALPLHADQAVPA